MPKSTSLAEKYDSMVESLQPKIQKDIDYYESPRANYRAWKNNDFLESMAEVIFSSNFDYETRVKPRWRATKKAFSNFDVNKVADYTKEDVGRIRKTPGALHNKLKIESIIENAKQMNKLIEEHGSFADYLCFYPSDLRKDLLDKFKYLGGESEGRVVLDFMKEMGFPVIKDDQHVRRVLYRLGLTKSEEAEQDEVLKVGKKIADAAGKKMPVIDAVLWSFGDRICKDKNPDCQKCHLTKSCNVPHKA